MKTSKRSVIASFCLAAALLCPVTLFAEGTAKKISVGLVLINLQAKFFNDINAGAQDAAKKAGVNLQVIDGNNDPSAQVNAVETLTQQKVDGIIMVAIDVPNENPTKLIGSSPGIRSCSPRHTASAIASMESGSGAADSPRPGMSIAQTVWCCANGNTFRIQ